MSRVYDEQLLRNPILHRMPDNATSWNQMVRELSRYTSNGVIGAHNMDIDPVRFDGPVSPAAAPAAVVIPGGSTVYALQFSGAAVNEVFFRMAIPEWLRDDRFDLVFRIHWGPTTAAAGQVVWNVDYQVSDPGTALAGAATTVGIPGGFVATSGIADDHMVTELTAVAGSALATATAVTGEAGMLLGRFWRNPAAAADTYGAAAWLWRLEARFKEV